MADAPPLSIAKIVPIANCTRVATPVSYRTSMSILYSFSLQVYCLQKCNVYGTNNMSIRETIQHGTLFYRIFVSRWTYCGGGYPHHKGSNRYTQRPNAVGSAKLCQWRCTRTADH